MITGVSRQAYEDTFETMPNGFQTPSFRQTGELWLRRKDGDVRLQHCVRVHDHVHSDPVVVASAGTIAEAQQALRTYVGPLGNAV